MEKSHKPPLAAHPRHAHRWMQQNFTNKKSTHTMDLLWEKFQWILPLYVKPISFQPKASVVCSVNAAIFIDFAWIN